jgi:hypothetical protein
MYGSTLVGYPIINDDIKFGNLVHGISLLRETQDQNTSILQDMKKQLIGNESILIGLSCCVCCLVISGVVLFGLVMHLYVK